MRIGVLAVQGDYEAHAAMLKRIGAEPVLVRTPADLAGVEALILPGGESTTQLQFLREEGLLDGVKEFAKQHAIFGTCAGTILLAKEVTRPAQASLELADMRVARNAYGRQLSSHVAEAPSKLKDAPLEMVFIRAPVIEQVGPQVRVLAEYEGRPVLVRQGKILAATFHPELTADTTVHEYFLKMARNGSSL